jgi:glycosyltransferase involved in cell wall biosynthesis
MKILIISQWYPPDPNRIFAELAESLQAAGHHVTVLTAIPNFPLETYYPGYKFKIVFHETINSIPIIRIPIYPSHSKSFLKRGLNFFSFAIALGILGPWLAPSSDLIYIIHPPITVVPPAWIIGKLKRAPLWLEIHDLWPETLAATKSVRNNTILKAIDRLVMWSYHRASAIRVISPGFKKDLIEKGVPDEKIHIVSNWVDLNLFKPLARDEAYARSLGLSGHFNVIYAGNIGAAQGLDTVLDAAALMHGNPQVQFVLVGGGAEREKLIQGAKARRITNLKIIGPYPMEEIPKIHALADVLLVHLRRDPLFRITIPHKIFACMASARPILAAVEGDAAEIIRGADAGLICPPSDAVAMAETVNKFMRMPEDEREKMGLNGLRIVRDSYSRAHLMDQIAHQIQKLVSR